MNRYHIIVKGRVQGVGFRFFSQSTAAMYDLTGYAKNMDNGTVEIEVQGDENKILKFLSNIKKGTLFIKVDDILISKIDLVHDENSFKIKY